MTFDMRKRVPCSCIDTIKYWYDQGRIISLQTPVETDYLRDSSYSQQDDRKYRCQMAKLVARVFVRQTAGK